MAVVCELPRPQMAICRAANIRCGGQLPDLPERIRGKQEKYQAYADRGMAALERYLQTAEQ